MHVQTETSTEIYARWLRDASAREAWINERAEQVQYLTGMDWDAAIACATNEYWDGDMPERIEQELRK